ncbi:MAG: hypothetical protein K0V04_05565 [Deltaproteobacteria bacterium]|nr:hypothetical protein [Deltaproteobacteria bacterium]
MAGVLGCGGDDVAGQPGAGTEASDSGTSATTETPADGTSSVGSSEGSSSDGTTDDGQAQLVLTRGDLLDFGEAEIGSQVALLVQVDNIGTADATGLMSTPLGNEHFEGPFGYREFQYPGTDGTCGESIAPGESCLIDLVYVPNLGAQLGQWSIDYDGGPGPLTADLQGSGFGTTASLVPDGGAEDCPPLAPPRPWIQPDGPHWGCVPGAFAGVDPFEGAQVFAAVLDPPLVTTLSLPITLVPSFGTATGTVMGALSVATISIDGIDEHRVQLRYLDQDGALIEQFDSGFETEATWSLVEDARLVPAAATVVEIILSCQQPEGGGACAAAFDAVDYRLSL